MDDEYISIDELKCYKKTIRKIYQLQPTNDKTKILEVGEFEGDLYNVVMGSFETDIAGKNVKIILSEIIHDDESIAALQKPIIPFLEIAVGEDTISLKIRVLFNMADDIEIKDILCGSTDISYDGYFTIIAYREDGYLFLEKFTQFTGIDDVVEKLLGHLYLIFISK
jgi:hypothetical protein